MKRTVKLSIIFLTFLGLFSCNNQDDTPQTKSLAIDIQGLEALGDNFVYEGWIIVNGNPISTGVFTDLTFPKAIVLPSAQLDSATKFVLSIEPANDTDPLPSDTKILVGDFIDNSADLSIATIGDFSNAMGKYILATPTNGANTVENSGIWFLDLPNSTPPPVAGLTLPELPSGWKYEGWVVINGVPVTTGKFTNLNATDAFDGYSGTEPLGMPNGNDGFFPGEDFLNSPPNGLTFPLDLAGKKAVISIEPNPDNNAGPFSLKPLVGMIPSNATDHVTYVMDTNINSFPSGMVTK